AHCNLGRVFRPSRLHVPACDAARRLDKRPRLVGHHRTVRRRAPPETASLSRARVPEPGPPTARHVERLASPQLTRERSMDQLRDTPRVAAISHLDNCAVIGETRRWTWREVHADSLALALRLDQGAAVFNLCNSRTGFLVAWLAALRR